MSEAGAASDEDVTAVLFDLLADEYARTILVATDREPLSAGALSERYDMSLPTVYRRVERLQEFDLVVEGTEIDTSGGHHRSVYEANLDHIGIDLEDGGFSLHVRLREDAPDRFTRLWREMRGD